MNLERISDINLERISDMNLKRISDMHLERIDEMNPEHGPHARFRSPTDTFLRSFFSSHQCAQMYLHVAYAHAHIHNTHTRSSILAGADIAAMANSSFADMLTGNCYAFWEQVAQSKIPTIAAINGFCLGGTHVCTCARVWMGTSVYSVLHAHA